MKFICDKNVIIREISIAQEIISSKNALSILSNVLLEADNDVLLIRATDLKVSFETRIPVVVESAGSTTVFCDKFLGILRTLPEGDVAFEQEGDKLLIEPVDKKIDFHLKSIAADKFPEIQDIHESQYFELPQKDLINMISQTIFSISDDETRYFMNGVYLEKSEDRLIMVATDGRRLSFISNTPEISVPDFSSVIIPPKVLLLIKKLSSGEGNLSLAVMEKTIFIQFDNQKISSTLIEGQFPNYNRVIPESQEFDIVVNRAELTEALRRVSLLAEQKSRRIFMKISSGVLTLESEENEIGTAKESISCNYEGPESVMALNCTYLMEPLKVITDEDVMIQYTEQNKAITLRSIPEQDYFHIIMPMQMD